jgi:hypothetical protein
VIWLVETGFNFRLAIANYTRAWGADIDVVEVDAAAVNVLVQRVSGGGREGGRKGETGWEMAYKEGCTCAGEEASEDRGESGGVHGGGVGARGGC